MHGIHFEILRFMIRQSAVLRSDGWVVGEAPVGLKKTPAIVIMASQGWRRPAEAGTTNAFTPNSVLFVVPPSGGPVHNANC